jgi:hypothetical protein
MEKERWRKRRETVEREARDTRVKRRGRERESRESV